MNKYIFGQGLYADFEIIFNNKSFLVHIKLLSKFFNYFRILEKNVFAEKRQLNITHYRLDNTILDPSYFGNLLYFIYHDIYRDDDHNMEDLWGHDIMDLVEYARLFKYFGYDEDLVFVKKELKRQVDGIGYTSLKNLFLDVKKPQCHNGCSYRSGQSNSYIQIKDKFKKIPNNILIRVYKPIISYEYLVELLEIFSYNNILNKEEVKKESVEEELKGISGRKEKEMQKERKKEEEQVYKLVSDVCDFSEDESDENEMQKERKKEEEQVYKLVSDVCDFSEEESDENEEREIKMEEFKYKLVSIAKLTIEQICQLEEKYRKVAMVTYCYSDFLNY